ncbi:hypothetical protein [Sphingomonas sp.]|uniref:hypothetical protein n=1 Tax=Sphingomonas sp. TaxID=28214 RepID=UPI003750E3DB
MATTNGRTRGRGTSDSKTGNTGPSRSRASSGRSNRSEASARDVAGGYAGGFIEAVKARPLTTAAIAASAAGASAFLWAKRTQLADQVSKLSDAINERFASDDSASTGMVSATDYDAATSSASKGRKNKGSVDPMVAKQS